MCARAFVWVYVVYYSCLAYTVWVCVRLRASGCLFLYFFWHTMSRIKLHPPSEISWNEAATLLHPTSSQTPCVLSVWTPVRITMSVARVDTYLRSIWAAAPPISAVTVINTLFHRVIPPPTPVWTRRNLLHFQQMLLFVEMASTTSGYLCRWQLFTRM